MFRNQIDFGMAYIRPFHLASTSGLLCLSTTCDEKFSRHIAAVRVDLTAARYGLSVLDFKYFQGGTNLGISMK